MTSTELGYLSGVTSNIQDQLNGKVGYSTATPNIRNAMYSNISTGWLMRDDMFDADGNYIQIGFDKTSGIYAYLNNEQIWNINNKASYMYIESDEDGSILTSQLDAILESMVDQEVKLLCCNPHPYYSGSRFCLILFRANYEWASLIGYSYNEHGDLIIMTKWDGVWEHIKTINKYGDSLPYGKNAIGQVFFLKSS